MIDYSRRSSGAFNEASKTELFERLSKEQRRDAAETLQRSENLLSKAERHYQKHREKWVDAEEKRVVKEQGLKGRSGIPDPALTPPGMKPPKRSHSPREIAIERVEGRNRRRSDRILDGRDNIIRRIEQGRAAQRDQPAQAKEQGIDREALARRIAEIKEMRQQERAQNRERGHDQGRTR